MNDELVIIQYRYTGIISGVFRISEGRGARGSGGLRLFVNEFLNFYVLEDQIISKTAKNIIIKITVS